MGDEQARPSYTCPLCERKSYNTGDIEHRYCGACNLEQDQAEATILRHGVAAGVAMLAVQRVTEVLSNWPARQQALRLAIQVLQEGLGDHRATIDSNRFHTESVHRVRQALERSEKG